MPVFCSTEVETRRYENKIGILKLREEKARHYVEEARREARRIEKFQRVHEELLQVVLSSHEIMRSP